VLLAVHTAIGAAWKFSNPPSSMPPLGAIPSAVWTGLSVVELLCVVALIVPAFNKGLAQWAPIAAAFIAAEMVFFSGVYLALGGTSIGPVVYWLVVAAICAFIAYGRLVLAPIRPVNSPG
jgi:hypothetical protein